MGTPLNLCLLGGALRIVLEAPAGIGDSVGVDEGLEGGGVVPVKYANGRHDLMIKFDAKRVIMKIEPVATLRVEMKLW